MADSTADPKALVREAAARLADARRECMALGRRHSEAQREVIRLSEEWGEASKRAHNADVDLTKALDDEFRACLGG